MRSGNFITGPHYLGAGSISASFLRRSSTQLQLQHRAWRFIKQSTIIIKSQAPILSGWSEMVRAGTCP